MTKDFCVLFCTASVDESEKIARMLIEERLAACVNITEVKSYYRWEGEFCEDKEALLIIKTVKSKVNKSIERIKEVHSYELPEIIALPIVAGYDKYLEWVDESVG
ncbi:MAG: divalent-cation tolerance protein CutA [Methanosarcinales archaeon]|nr:divalent-cation tolerance protein CutA [Methanosarcinales archaeon]